MNKNDSIFCVNRGALLLSGLALAIAAALVIPQTAQASAFQLKENSAQSMGRAYAGGGAAPGDASVVVNNPAAMAWFKHSYLKFDATAISFNAQFNGGATDALGRPISGGDGGNAGGVIPVPAFMYLRPINDQWVVGFGVSAPFGFKTQYNPGWVGRYNAIKSDLKSVDATFSVSYKVTEQLALGASLIAQRTSVDLTNAVDFGAILSNPATFNLAPAFLPQSADGYARIKGHNWKWGWQVGASWKPTDVDTFGILYHAKIHHVIHGQATFSVPSQVQGVFTQANLPLFQNTAGTANYSTPTYINLSYWRKMSDRLSLGVEADWTQWSSFKTLTVNFTNPYQPPSSEVYNWRDSHYISVGGDYKLSKQLTLSAGVAIDSTPTYNLTRSPRVPDASRRWISFGLTYKPLSNFKMSLGYAHLFVSNANVNIASATQDRLTGYYNNSADLLAFSSTYRF